MHRGWWPAHARTSKRFFPFCGFFCFLFFFFSPKYIIVNHFFFIHNSLMQNSYSDNRCHGVSYYFCARVVCACTRATPGPTYIQYFLPSASLCLSFRTVVKVIFVLRSAALPACPPCLSGFFNHRCRADLPRLLSL